MIEMQETRWTREQIHLNKIITLLKCVMFCQTVKNEKHDNFMIIKKL